MAVDAAGVRRNLSVSVHGSPKGEGDGVMKGGGSKLKNSGEVLSN